MRGKKTDPEKIYEVMSSFAITNNLSETARVTNMPFGTVKNIVDENRDKEEFKKVQDQKREEFADKASVIIDMLLSRITDTVADGKKDIPLHHLTTAMGTLFDKRALSRGEMTQNVHFATNSETLDKLAQLSGYDKFKKAEDVDDE